MAEFKIEDYLKDSKGRFVPKEIVSEYEKEKEVFFNDIEEIFNRHSKQIEESRTALKEEIESFTAKASSEFKKELGGQVSLSLSNFSGDTKIEYNTVNDSDSFYLKKRNDSGKFITTKTGLN